MNRKKLRATDRLLIEALEGRQMLAATGLAGVYYPNADLTGNPVAARVDSVVNFTWSGSPAAGVSADHFSVRWTGKLNPRYTGKYTFITKSDDGVRLFVNGTKIIDNWTSHAAVENVATAVLSAGVNADIKMEFYDGSGGATAQFFWQSKSQAREIVPTSQLTPAALPVVTPPPPVAPPTPIGLGASPVSSSQIKVVWSDVAGETGYKVERSISATTGFVQVNAPAANVTSFTDSGLTGSTTYYYRLRAANGTANSGYSVVVNAKTQAVVTPPPAVPAVPGSVAASAVSASQIKLTWADVSGETSYKVERSTNATAGFVQVNAPGANATSFTDSGLAASTTYYYRLRAANGTGNSNYSVVVNAKTQAVVTPPPAIPPVPGSFAAAAVSVSQIKLTWSDVAGETSYKIERSTNATTGFVQVNAPAANATSFTDAGLTASTTYYYRLRASNVTGDSGYSAVVNAKTQAVVTPPPGAPAVPGNFAATAMTASTIKLTWTDDSNETGYRIEKSADGVSGWTLLASPAVNAVSYSDNNLSASTTYYYRMLAGNGSGNSAYTAVKSAKTQAPQPPPPGSTYQPDALIQIHHDTTFIGDGVINATADGQTKTGSPDFYGIVFKIRVQNDGTAPDSFIVNGPAGDANFRVTYYDSFVFGWNGGSNITEPVTGASGYNTGNVDPGAWREFRVEVLPLAALGGDTRTLNITITSAHDSTKKDVVRGVVNNPVVRQVAWRRQNFDQGGTYLMTIQNQGNLPDQFTVNGTGSGTTWSAQYFDEQFGGNDVSAAVKSGAGWKTKVLAPWESQTFRVVFSGTDISEALVNLTAASVAKPDTKEQLAIDIPKPVKGIETPFFPIGVWTQPVSSFDKWKSRGVNTLIEYQGDGATIAQWSQAARDRGMYYIRKPDAPQVNDLGDPNLLAWAFPDEPEITSKYPAATLAQYKINWNAIDPSKPIWVNFSGGFVLKWQGGLSSTDYKTFTDSVDWISSSIYPVTGWNRPITSPGLDAPGQAIDRLEKWTDGKPQWAVIENADQELSWIQKEIPGPNAGQFRAEVWDSVIHGAKGVIYFPESFSPSFKFDNTPPEIVAEMTSVDAKLQSLAGVLLSDIDPPTLGLKTSGPLEGTWRMKDGKAYFVVLNFSDTAVTQSVTLQGVGDVSSAAVHGEDRSVAVSNGTLKDTFAPFSVHVYQVG